jgi:hypothetical protein
MVGGGERGSCGQIDGYEWNGCIVFVFITLKVGIFT